MHKRPLPTITVITVTRNDLDGLRKTIDSVTAQTDCAFEHWIIDGGSTDGSPALLAQYVDGRTDAHYVSEPDGGIFDAMNKGIRLATGDVLVFLNSGDLFTDPGVLWFVASEWASGDWEWGYGAIRYVSPSGEITSGTVQSPFRRRGLELGFRFAPWPATYISRELITRLGGFDERFGVAADQELAIRAAAASEPRTWVRFMADFLLGGVHSQGGFLERERLWHRMRMHNGVPLLGSRVLDLAAAFGVAGFRGLHRNVGAYVKRRRP